MKITKFCKDCKWRNEYLCKSPQNMTSFSHVDGQ
jgi:hypothetical protein